MKNTFILFNVICLMTVSSLLLAQSKDEKAVATVVNTLKKVMIEGDGKALKNITADELTYGHSSGKIENKTEYIESLVSGRSDFVTMDLTEQTIKVVGNTALVRHDLKAHVADGGIPADIHLGILLVWQKQKGQWKLLARQAYKL